MKNPPVSPPGFVRSRVDATPGFFAFAVVLAGMGFVPVVFAALPPKQEVVDPNAPISYWKQIRPIFQANAKAATSPPATKAASLERL